VWRVFKNQLKSAYKKRPSVCPVCLTIPQAEDWYTTRSCKHSVCRECLHNYALSQLEDKSHSGALKCPCCPRLLRRIDAQVALDVMPKKPSSLSRRGGTDGSIDFAPGLEFLKKVQDKQLVDALRRMASFRPCPHCSAESHPDYPHGERRSGGGFVSPDCIAPINQVREDIAKQIINLAGRPAAIFTVLCYAIYYLRSCRSSSSGSAVATQILTVLLPSLFVPIVPHFLRLLLSKLARAQLSKPIFVGCPVCEKEFPLEASSELYSKIDDDAATEHWKKSHTRPCPQCGVSIEKRGGCNHVHCSHCHTNFCWACMRKRSRCSSYQCSNGSPYGNAFGDGSRRAVLQGLVLQEREQQEGMTLLERIDSIGDEAKRNLRIFSQLSAHILPVLASAPAVCIAIAAAHNLPLISSFAVVLLKRGLLAIVLFLSLRSRLEARRAHWERERDNHAGHGVNNVPPGDTVLAEAIRRSIEEY